jgi:PAS domain S-box-containing protein
MSLTENSPPTRRPQTGVTPDGDFETDRDGRITRVDDRACRLLDVRETELLGRPFFEFLAAGQDTRIAADRSRMANHNVIRTEWRLRRGDGTEFTAEIIARGLEGEAMRFIARDATALKALDMARAHLAAIVESSEDAIISKTLDGVVTTWNRGAEHIFGYTAEDMIGQSIRRLVPEDRATEEDEILARLERGERIPAFETVRRHKDGSPVLVSVTLSPILSHDGRIVGASTIARDVRGIYETQEQLRESDARFRALADSISHFAWMADAKGWVFWYNQRWYDYTGTTLDEMQGWGWKAVHHPDHLDRVLRSIQRSLDTGGPWEDTHPLRGADGDYRWFLSRALPIRDEQGRVTRWFGTNTDITEQKEREDHIGLLMREVNHRAKNLLAVVQAIARQTATANPTDFIDRFQERIQGLAASQDLLISSGWRGAGIVDLICSQLAHFESLIGSRILLIGPELTLTAEASQALGMVLHELGTNAGKYGALSSDEGTVQVDWHERGVEDQCELVMRWRESGGPPVEAPERRGFGSVVIERMMESSLSATTQLEFAREGVRWRLQAPSTKVIAERPPSTQAANTCDEPPPCRGLRILVVDADPKRAMLLAEQLQAAEQRAVGPATTVEQAFTFLADEALDGALIGPGTEAEDLVLLRQRMDELSLHVVLLPAQSQSASGARNGTDSCAITPDKAALRDVLQALCDRRPST